MKSLTSIIGWLLLVAVLAVPSFLFYNWWTKNKQQSSAEVSQGQATGNPFPSQEKPAAAPAAPALKSTAAPAGLPAQPPAAERPPDASAQPPAAPAAPAPRPVVLATAPVQAMPVVKSSAAPAAVAVSTRAKTASFYAPKGDRDPTLSPDDYRRIKEAELQREEEIQRRKEAERNRPKEATCDSRVHLQGIVGNAAIINGEMYSVGQTVAGSKITKIGPNYIQGECKNRKFRKVLQ